MKTGEPPHRHPTRACNQCKQQKLRCNASTDYPSPCARCKKHGLECKVEDGFRRVNKRQRTEFLNQENDLLRQRLEATTNLLERHESQDPVDQPNRQSGITPISVELSNSSTSLQHDFNAVHQDQIAPPTHTSVYDISQAVQPNASNTLTRTIGGVQLESKEIDEIFAIYFSHYARHLPIVDPDKTPNETYDDSPLLFWSIVGVGCRRYDSNPTLAYSIADPILHLGWPPLHRVPTLIPAIKGLLLLSSFPLSTACTSNDISYTLSGMAINLALQIGLHVPLHRHEFNKDKSAASNDDVAPRVILWFHCLVVHQKAACALGYPITVSPHRLKKQMDLRGLTQLVPASVQLEMTLGSILSRINPLFSPSTLPTGEAAAKFARAMMSDAFEAQLDQLEESRTLSRLEKLYLDVARLQLRAYHLQSCGDAASIGVAKLAIVAASVIEACATADTDFELALYCPHYVYRMVALAAAVLLRVLKATRSTQSKETYETAKPTFFKAITLLKKMSVEDNDGPSRMAHMLSRLWGSDKMFRLQNGQKTSFRVGVQSRLSMSVLHEMTWWYHEEFGPDGKGRSSPDRAPARSFDSRTAGGSDSRACPDHGDRVPDGYEGPSDMSTTPSRTLDVVDLAAGFLTPSYWGASFDQSFDTLIDDFQGPWRFEGAT